MFIMHDNSLRQMSFSVCQLTYITAIQSGTINRLFPVQVLPVSVTFRITFILRFNQFIYLCFPYWLIKIYDLFFYYSYLFLCNLYIIKIYNLFWKFLWCRGLTDDQWLPSPTDTCNSIFL